jgi:hypothetical protein
MADASADKATRIARSRIPGRPRACRQGLC